FVGERFVGEPFEAGCSFPPAVSFRPSVQGQTSRDGRQRDGAVRNARQFYRSSTQWEGRISRSQISRLRRLPRQGYGCKAAKLWILSQDGLRTAESAH